MHFNLITATSLSLLLLCLSISIPSVLGFTDPGNVTGDERYNLISMANPLNMLVSDSSESSGPLRVMTVDPLETARNARSAKARTWNMYDGLESLLNVRSNGYLYFDQSLKTNGQVFPTKYTHVNLVEATGNLGKGIKIRVTFMPGNAEVWVDENAQITVKFEDAAIWAITRVKGGKTRRFRQLG